jgi:hypothetical protein
MDPRPTGLELTDAPRPPLPPLPPASRELLEVLWDAGRPLRTRQIHDAVRPAVRPSRRAEDQHYLVESGDTAQWSSCVEE